MEAEPRCSHQMLDLLIHTLLHSDLMFFTTTEPAAPTTKTITDHLIVPQMEVLLIHLSYR